MSTQKWIAGHLSELIKKYPGLYVAVVENKVVSFGTSAKKVEEEAREKCRVKVPSVVPIPNKDDLLHVLCRI